LQKPSCTVGFIAGFTADSPNAAKCKASPKEAYHSRGRFSLVARDKMCEEDRDITKLFVFVFGFAPGKRLGSLVEPLKKKSICSALYGLACGLSNVFLLRQALATFELELCLKSESFTSVCLCISQAPKL
jgi:hypothetical protein